MPDLHDTPGMPMFSTWMAHHRRGELDAEVTAALAEVASAVSALGKGGKVTIVLALKAAGPSARTLLLVDSVKATVPEAERESAVYFIDREGCLSRNDPYQQRLDHLLRVNPATGELTEMDS